MATLVQPSRPIELASRPLQTKKPSMKPCCSNEGAHSAQRSARILRLHLLQPHKEKSSDSRVVSIYMVLHDLERPQRSGKSPLKPALSRRPPGMKRLALQCIFYYAKCESHLES